MPNSLKQNADISLVVVTYKRPHLLIESLKNLEPHLSLFREIIVVDNDRSNELKSSLENDYGNLVKIIHPDKNLGAAGRSIGILASTGKIVLTLDDDIQLIDPKQLEYLSHQLLSKNKIGCINFKIVYSETGTLDFSDWCHPRDPYIYSELAFESTYISEGACLFDGDMVRNLGAYPLDLFIGQEGVELAARILDNGHSIFYFPGICVKHSVAEEGRASGRQFYYNTRNIYWIALRCYPLMLAIKTLIREWTALFLFSLARNRAIFFLRGCYDGILYTPTLIKQRKAINHSTVYRISQINNLKPSLFKRLLRVRKSKTLD